MLDMGDGQPVELAEVEEANPESLLSECFCRWQPNTVWR